MFNAHSPVIGSYTHSHCQSNNALSSYKLKRGNLKIVQHTQNDYRGKMEYLVIVPTNPSSHEHLECSTDSQATRFVAWLKFIQTLHRKSPWQQPPLIVIPLGSLAL
jgi:hypothetical protein